MLAAAALGVLVGVAIMFLIAGRIAEDRLDKRVDNVTKEFNDSLNRLRQDVQRELDARSAQGGVPPVTPTPTPFSAPTPETTPTPESDGSATPTPTPSADDSLPDPESTPDGEVPRP